MADPAEHLERLRRLRGIGHSFTDFRGQVHVLSEDSLRRLLEALGHAVDDHARLQEQADALEEQEWTRVLPPVVVLRRERRVPFSVLAPLLPRVRWRVETEQGEMLSGTVEPAGLQVLGERGIQALWYVRLSLELPPLPLGYHRLLLEKADGTTLGTTRLIVAPERCFEPDIVRRGGRVWGPAIQLYTLRSPRNWGIGDFTDLRGFAVAAASLGADVVGLNPLHALFPADPAVCGPYSPSSRYFLNVLYIDPEAVPEFAQCTEAQRLVRMPEFQARLARLRAAPFVDYPGVAACKLEVLRVMHADFHARASTARRFEFETYVNEGGQALERYALFHALHMHLSAAGAIGGWPAWPTAYRDPQGAAVEAFRVAEADAVDFHRWLQWIAATQLEAAEVQAREAGLRLGFYRDLAVGPNEGGAETWGEADLYALGATVGAPPDPLALQGQDWGIPPFQPGGLRALAYEPFVELLRANMGRDGALRIDHVMMLFRLWWVPRGLSSAAGGYVHYRLDELMAIVALESHRQRCLVIGENLGTVPPEVSAAMSDHGMYAYKVLLFEREADGRFRRPADYPRQALAAVSTHDLPPLASFWEGSDIELRERLGLYPDPGLAEAERVGRAEARAALLAALADAGLAPAGLGPEPALPAPLAAALVGAVQSYLARTPSAVLLLQPEDWLIMDTPVNVPGTHTAYLNWARKLPVNWPEFMSAADVKALGEALASTGRGAPMSRI